MDIKRVFINTKDSSVCREAARYWRYCTIRINPFSNSVQRMFPKWREKDFSVNKTRKKRLIITIIKQNNGVASIKDIMSKINLGTKKDSVCSEKTARPSYMSMLKMMSNKSGETGEPVRRKSWVSNKSESISWVVSYKILALSQKYARGGGR